MGYAAVKSSACAGLAADRIELGRAWQDNGLIFTTRTGRPIKPRNLVRSFRRICEAHERRVIKQPQGREGHRDALGKISDELGGSTSAGQ